MGQSAATAAAISRHVSRVPRSLGRISLTQNIPRTPIFHSDRGSQYTAKEVMTLLSALGIRQSFSRVGMPGENAWSESFFSILKKEIVYPHKFETREQARCVIFEYIEAFYNRVGVQKHLRFRAPIQALSAALQVAA